MNATEHAAPTTATPVFVPIPRRGPRPVARPGCLLLAAGIVFSALGLLGLVGVLLERRR